MFSDDPSRTATASCSHLAAAPVVPRSSYQPWPMPTMSPFSAETLPPLNAFSTGSATKGYVSDWRSTWGRQRHSTSDSTTLQRSLSLVERQCRCAKTSVTSAAGWCLQTPSSWIEGLRLGERRIFATNSSTQRQGTFWRCDSSGQQLSASHLSVRSGGCRPAHHNNLPIHLQPFFSSVSTTCAKCTNCKHVLKFFEKASSNLVRVFSIAGKYYRPDRAMLGTNYLSLDDADKMQSRTFLFNWHLKRFYDIVFHIFHNLAPLSLIPKSLNTKFVLLLFTITIKQSTGK